MFNIINEHCLNLPFSNNFFMLLVIESLKIKVNHYYLK